MSAPCLEVKGLTKSFGLKPILRGVDLVLGRGECIALLGANGAGKTTLLRVLAGLTGPSAGTVCIEGWDIVHDAQQVRGLVGFVGHQAYLYEELTVLENLLFFGRMYGVKQKEQRASELLSRVGLEKRAQERVGSLSRGQVQRDRESDDRRRERGTGRNRRAGGNRDRRRQHPTGFLERTGAGPDRRRQYPIGRSHVGAGGDRGWGNRCEATVVGWGWRSQQFHA